MNSRVIKWVGSWIMAVALLLGCSSDGITEGNAQMSECLRNINSESISESIKCITNAHGLSFLHSNRYVSCDATKCDITVKVDGNTLYIYEKVTAKNEVNCICPVNIEYTIKNLEYKTYTTKVMVDETVYAEFELVFDSNCDFTHVINY